MKVLVACEESQAVCIAKAMAQQWMGESNRSMENETKGNNQ